jgi:hypothetical protein
LYSASGTTFTVNEPISVKFSIKNNTGQPIMIDVPFNFYGYGGFHGKLLRPDGQKEEGPKPRAQGFGPSGRFTIDPLLSYSEELLLNKWFTFDIPGRYIVDIEMTRPVRVTNGDQLPYRGAGRLLIDLGPRDSVKLAKICSDLKDQILASTSGASRKAAEVLANLNDPVAIPHLNRILEEREDDLGWMMVAGIQHIGNIDAVNSLIRYVGSQNSDTQALSVGALTTIESKTHDDQVKVRIQEWRRQRPQIRE